MGIVHNTTGNLNVKQQKHNIEIHGIQLASRANSIAGQKLGLCVYLSGNQGDTNHNHYT